MKKIGILYGQERSFPMAFIERINSKNIEGITAEPVHIDKAMQGEQTPYAVIVDRISQDVPFYRTWLKNAALTGQYEKKTPFWWSSEKNYSKIGVVTKMGFRFQKPPILPFIVYPPEKKPKYFATRAFPLDWGGIFN